MLFGFSSNPSTTTVFNEMNTVATSFLETKRNKFNPIQIESQVPYWMIKNSDGYGNPSMMIPFLQIYYDWLTETFGYDSVNIFDMRQLFDISETPSFLLPSFVKTYAPDISGIFNLQESLKPKDSSIRNTITNIKTEIYEYKSNELAFYRLMSSLFNINPDTISITYPKTKIMRLNGGLLPWMSFGSNPEGANFIGSTGSYSNERYSLIGSYLNSSVLQDGNLWQEYSYVINSEIDDSNPYYAQIVKQTLHPAGLAGFFEQKISFEEQSGNTGGEIFDYEVPIIAYYYPYTLGSTASLPKCSGCTGSLHVAGWTFPTFVYPTWDIEIGMDNPPVFGMINVYDFFTLQSTNGNQSPNDAIGILCTFACEATGDANILWDAAQNSEINNPRIDETYTTDSLENQPRFGIGD